MLINTTDSADHNNYNKVIDGGREEGESVLLLAATNCNTPNQTNEQALRWPRKCNRTANHRITEPQSTDTPPKRDIPDSGGCTRPSLAKSGELADIARPAEMPATGRKVDWPAAPRRSLQGRC
ncbi:hypothetical protein PoB_005259000 [Plakobranchus ocellatus]|uniref:Uncharacterized protein n=1 Tax=Plakobranchus ocellatus TaxID=259542 RepID=A0AAV4C3X4_9GAST|nr:hypothetical protein PoB_005259000 [Plakobranchus ocellatus]